MSTHTASSKRPSDERDDRFTWKDAWIIPVIAVIALSEMISDFYTVEGDYEYEDSTNWLRLITTLVIVAVAVGAWHFASH